MASACSSRLLLVLLSAACGRQDIELYPGLAPTLGGGPPMMPEPTPDPDPDPDGPSIADPEPDEPTPEQCAAVAPPGLLAALPPMGWNGWNSFACSPELDDQRVRGIADAMITSGMQAAGYHYVNLDNCWELERSAAGEIVEDPAKLPDGMRSLSLSLHMQGFKLGVFRRAGDCLEASAARYTADAAKYAEWGVDLLKVVACQGGDVPATRGDYEQLVAALEGSGRSVVLSITAPPFAEWMPAVGQMFRSSPPIAPSWESILEVLDATAPLAAYARPGAYNDPDILELGVADLTEAEARAHFSLWSILSAPLLAGNDLTTMSESTRQILTNQEMIALDQDPLGLQGALLRREGDLDVYAKPLAGCGARGVVLFNRGSAPIDTTLSWSELWLEPGSATARDLWSHTDVVATDSLSLSVPPHDVIALRVVGIEPPTPRSEVWLDEVPFTYVTNGYGPVERNTSNGETDAGDGQPLSMRGRVYARGLGVHPPALIRYRLGGTCTRFTAQVGVDDEVEGHGSVFFQVWSDGEKLFDSGVMTGTTPPRQVDVSLENRMDLRLFVGTADDGVAFDHADWAEARLTCESESEAR